MNNEILKDVSTRVSQANNVLVAVSNNPSVDELSAAVGLTLFLNKLGKHATTVFSGVVPSTLEFLQPDQAIEKTTDSLRDFIIALDKSKADKLRYKVEDDVVRIFITPYKTTITESDLDFSLGEFNVDVVIAIGISKRDDVDQAVTAHGRILHDATVLALTNKENSDFGVVNWNEPQASSLSEMVSAVAYTISAEKIDGQMATALLTGIISETDRFRNESTTPQSLDFASRLMRAGANQQLIADELEAAVKLQNTADMSVAEELPRPHNGYDVPQPLDHKEDDGSLQIEHKDEQTEEELENIHIDSHGNLSNGDLDNDSAPVENQDKMPTNNPYLQPNEQQGNNSEDVAFDIETADDQKSRDQQTMTHGKTINPLHEPEFPTSPSEPFDAQKAFEAMQAEQAGSLESISDATQDLQPQPASEVPAPPEQTTPDIPSPLVESPQEELPPASVFEEPISQSQPEQPSNEDQQQHHEQTLEDLEQAVGSPHVQQQVSTEVPQPVVTPADEPKAETVPQPVPENPQQSPENSQAIDMSTVPKPLTEDEQGSDSPPPVPPPMQPLYFDNNANPPRQ